MIIKKIKCGHSPINNRPLYIMYNNFEILLTAQKDNMDESSQDANLVFGKSVI